jgi:hypothetical protein
MACSNRNAHLSIATNGSSATRSKLPSLSDCYDLQPKAKPRRAIATSSHLRQQLPDIRCKHHISIAWNALEQRFLKAANVPLGISSKPFLLNLLKNLPVSACRFLYSPTIQRGADASQECSDVDKSHTVPGFPLTGLGKLLLRALWCSAQASASLALDIPPMVRSHDLEVTEPSQLGSVAREFLGLDLRCFFLPKGSGFGTSHSFL